VDENREAGSEAAGSAPIRRASHQPPRPGHHAGWPPTHPLPEAPPPPPSGGGQPESPAPSPGGEIRPEPPAGAGTQVAAGRADVAEVDTLRQELAERSDQLLRLAADFENFRRRKAQELADRGRYASEEAARALLPVLDNLRRAVEHLPSAHRGAVPVGTAEGGDQLQDGLRMVVAQFEQALSAIGVEPVETVGAAFDPAVHEAIGSIESDQVTEDTVVRELQPGYRLHDRLLRPALVQVARPRRPVTFPLAGDAEAPVDGG